MRERTNQAHIAGVRDAIQFIRKRLDDGVDLEVIAEAACMAPHHFHRAFKRLTGLGVAEHIRSLRLLKAAMALRETNHPITRIASGAGYSSDDALRRAFRTAFGVSPRDYRKRARRQAMEHPMNGAEIGFIKIPVTDFTAACQFYRETLGLTEDFAVEAFGWAQYGTGSVPICVYVAGQGGGDGQPGGETGIQLRVADAKRAHAHLGDHAEADLGTGDDGTITFHVRDPDGNRLQVAQVG